MTAIGGGWRGAGIGGGGGLASGAGATVTITGGSVKAIAGGNGAKAIGAGAAGSAAGTDHGTLKNGSGANVVLYTFTITGVTNTAVTNLTTTSALGYTYGTTNMKTDGEGKLYVYLPSGKTKALATTDSYAYSGSIASNAATLNTVYPVSGTVNAGTTEASVSGRTVNLYASTDAAFSTSVGSATTNGSGVYTIYAPNGNYVARVAGTGSYAASVSGAITVSSSAVSGADITLSRAAYTGPNADTPTLMSITDTQAVLNPVTVTGQTVEYGKNTSSATPTAWQDSTTFTDLTANTIYYFFARVKQAGAVEAGGVSSSLTVTTKNAAPAAPSLAFNSITATSVTITAVADAEYSKDNGTSWQDENAFTGLSAATQYTFAIRIKETAGTAVGTMGSQAQYTLPTTPLASVVTVNYSEETISFANTYEVSSSAGFDTNIPSGSALTAGTTYYIRVAANGGVPASESVSFAIATRPAAPTAITADKTKNSITITPVAGQEYTIGSDEWQDIGSFTGLSANSDYTVYARVKATGSAFASESYSMNITTKSVGSVTVPTLAAMTYDPNKKLADTALPTGWAWSVPETVPTVAIKSYSAVYTPTNIDTIDYSDVAGYAVDGTGKVTITRTVPLTVNRATPTTADFTYIAPASLDYSGTAKTAMVAVNDGITGMGAVTVKCYDKDGAVVDAPTNAGTYTVKINVVQGDNYAAATDITDSTWTFTIANVPQASLSITKKPASIIYGDTFTLETTGGSGNGDVRWAVTPGGSATVDELTGGVTITGIGETTITATKAADGNYTDAVTDTYTLIPAKRLITVGAPSATGGWTKTYDGKTDFDKSIITVGGITNKVGSDAVNVAVQSAAYNTADVGSGNKTLTITYAIDGTNSGNYAVPNNTVISTASIAVATPTITIKSKTAVYTDKKIEIDAATVNGVASGTTPDGAITYTYYTKDTCTDIDKTTVDKSGADNIGGAPKTAGTYYVKANIAASGNYTAATSAAVTLTIYYPSSGENNSSAPVIVDGKTVDMGTSEVKDGTTTVKVDQNKMVEQLKSAKDSVVIPITSKTDTASAQLVVQNVENMAARSITLTVKANDVSYDIPAGSVDTAAILKNLGASDSAKVPLNVTISKLSNNSVTIKDGTLMVPPVAFTITATYNGKNVEVDKFESYVQRVIEIPNGVDPKTITTAVVAEANGTQRHVPTEVYSEGGNWFAKISSMTNSTYALIQNSVSFTDITGKWYAAVATEMASRKVISGIGENMFAGDRSITRAEFTAILIRALGLPADGTSSFSDIPTTAWYTGTVATAVQYGLVAGKGENRYDPNANITRQEAMLMLQRAAALTELSGASSALDGFVDADSVDFWAKDAVKWSVGSGLIQGADGKLNPTANITRAESTTIILRLLQKAGLVDVRS